MNSILKNVVEANSSFKGYKTSLYNKEKQRLYFLFELNNIAPLWERVWFNMHLVPGRAKEISAEWVLANIRHSVTIKPISPGSKSCSLTTCKGVINHVMPYLSAFHSYNQQENIPTVRSDNSIATLITVSSIQRPWEVKQQLAQQQEFMITRKVLGNDFPRVLLKTYHLIFVGPLFQPYWNC